MKLFLALISSFALASAVHAEQDQNNKKKKNHQQNQQVQQQQLNKQNQHAINQQNKLNRHQLNQNQHGEHKLNKLNKHEANLGEHAEHKANKLERHDLNQNEHAEHKLNKQEKHLAHQEHKQHEFKKFETSKGWKKDVQSEKFVQGKHIKGSENWHGDKYVVFQNYHSDWHDQGWWHQHYGGNVILISGGWYYQNAGFWFPAWGYDPGYTYYPYDGPIYAYHNLPPDQVIANVQAVLQEEGFYQGEVDGLLGPLTRAAIASYQEANGLYVTSAIDQPTMEALGLT